VPMTTSARSATRMASLDEVALAYAITIHKFQGSEFPAVVIPLATQHYLLLQRNLVYTGVTRGRQLVVLIGQKKATGHRGAEHAHRPAVLRAAGAV